MKVALFITCVNDGLFPNTPKAVVEVLERLGHDVVFPTEQTCCGQMHLNAGYRQEGLHLAQRFRQVFSDYDVIVSPSASCVGTVRDLYATSARSLGDDALADDLEVPLLGQVPLVPALRVGGDVGVPVRVADPTGEAALAFDALATRLEELGPARIYRRELNVR